MSSRGTILTDYDVTKIANQFSRLKGKTYLDNGASSLYAKCQIEAVHADLIQNIYPNPHTSNSTSNLVDQVRYDVLHAFNTNPDEYSLIFTSGSTSALKLVAETFRFDEGAFGYITDNHTSVLGMREIAKAKGVEVFHISPDKMNDVTKNITNHVGKYNCGSGLFVYPAESNFNGVKYPLRWTSVVQNGALNEIKPCANWFVFLDTATFASTNRIDLAEVKPDFLCLSFYKIFGYPTGVGALLVKNSSAHILSEKSYFGGGTVDAVLSGGDYHVKRDNIIQRFEDGTLPFLSILAIKHGFDALNRLIPKLVNNNTMETISHHTFMLAKHLYEQLQSLHHTNGAKAVKLYADTDYQNEKCQGGIINFNLLRSNGEYIGYAEVAHMSELFKIHLRVGSFCNSGATQRHLKMSNEEYRRFYEAGHVCGDENDLIDGRPTGCIRVSFGYMNSMKDIDSLLNMICKCFVDGRPVYIPFIRLKSAEDNIENNHRRANGTTLTETQDEMLTIIPILRNGHDTKYENDIKTALKSICLYPVKSCGAYECNNEWTIGPKGLLYDREWMVVKESGVALTQKDETRMCLIKPSFNFERNALILSYPDMDDISVPLVITPDNLEVTSSLCRSKVCGDRITGFDCGDKVGDWLSNALDIFGLRLLRQSNEMRPFKSKKDQGSKSLALANQAQYLLINRTSVLWLADQVESGEFNGRTENLIKRFRGNLIVDTALPFVENEWKEIVISGNIFKVEGPCTRCQMICIDQETGSKTTEPLGTISKVFKGKLRFGIYLSYIDSINNEKSIICGDSIPHSITT